MLEYILIMNQIHSKNTNVVFAKFGSEHLNNVVYIIYHSPPSLVIDKGEIYREDDKKVYIQFKNKSYVYIKDANDIGTYFCRKEIL